MKFQLFLIGLLSILLGCSPKSTEQILKKESLPAITKVKNCQFELYMCQGEISEQATDFLTGNEIKIANLVIEKLIYTKNPLKVDKTHLINTITTIFPSKNEKGIGVLDWEGQAIKILKKAKTDSDEFKNMLAEYNYALSICKKERPNVKWGFYGLPLRDYWNRNEAWRSRTAKLMPLFKNSDILFPSVYDFYQNNAVNRESDSLYVNDNVELALEMGDRAKIPVLPFFYHRYHPSNKKVGAELIPWDEFEFHIDAALKASYKGRKIEGIVWWGADRYSYNTNHKIVKKEASMSKSFDSYQNKLIVNYSQNIYKLFEKNCK